MNQTIPQPVIQEQLPNTLPDIFQLINVVQKKLKGIQRQTIQETGLTPPQYFLLTLLWERDSQAVKDLADASGYARATITGIVDTMEKHKIVTREPNPEDRRSLLVTLTEKGKELQHASPALENIFQQCCCGLSSDEIRQLGQLLKKLETSLTCENN